VDELRLMVFPVVLRRGTRLLGETSGKKPLRQVDAKTVGEGVTILAYEPVRASGPRSDAPDLETARAATFEGAGIRESR
jgi:hypothetical protein